MPAMSGTNENGEVDEAEFKWGVKRGRGGTKKDVQFYESFTYDGEEYSLYDSVYLYKDGEAEPYVGKLVKIWEAPRKQRKVKVLWFFRPSEISFYLGGVEHSADELFLGTGVGAEGSGLENINPLEAIARKCNVVCTSKDERNRKPSAEELNMADYIFYRTFDVDKFNISDKLEEKISKIDVKFLLNKNNSQISNPLRIESSNKGRSRDLVADAAEEGLGLQKKDTVKVLKADPSSEAVPIERESAARHPLDIGKHSPVFNSDGAAAAYVGKVDASKKDADSGGKMLDSKAAEVQVLKNATSLQKSSSRDHLKSELDDGSKYCSDKSKEAIVGKYVALGVNGLKHPSTPKPEFSKNSSKPSEAIEKVNHGGDHGSLDGQPFKKPKSEDYSRSTLKLALNADKSNLKEVSSSAAVSNDKQKHEHTKDSHVPLKVKSPAGNSSDERPFKKLKSAEHGGSSMQNSASNSAGGKIKAHLYDALADDGKLKRVVKDSSGGNVCFSNKIINGERVKKLPNDKSHIAPSKHINKKGAKVCGRVVEVNRRPDADSSKWFTSLPWEDRMKAAQDEGRLVLLQNLDPTYTSSEVEDIVWHSFHEICTAKVVQRTAISSPYSGQAFVIFKTKPAAIRVLRELEEGVLMLPNGRPLLGRVGKAHMPGKPSSFPGHLVIDKLRHQMQRREAVSTSHSSQPNNSEYDMAMEWCVLQERSELMWKNLRKIHVEEFKKLGGNLKRKL